MQMQASTSRKQCITKQVRKLTLTANSPWEEIELAQLFNFIRKEGVGEVVTRCCGQEKEAAT